MKLVILYSLFALLATLINIASQELALVAYSGPGSIYPAIIAGTLTGLIVKYLLDRQFIFQAHSPDLRNHASTFLLYSITGVLTTLLFWGMELLFDALIGTRGGRYTGAVLGLTIGYVLKYQLDKRYVFTSCSVTLQTRPVPEL